MSPTDVDAKPFCMNTVPAASSSAARVRAALRPSGTSWSPSRRVPDDAVSIAARTRERASVRGAMRLTVPDTAVRFLDVPVVDADSHVLEPPDLWETRLDRKYRDRGVRIHDVGGV